MRDESVARAAAAPLRCLFLHSHEAVSGLKFCDGLHAPGLTVSPLLVIRGHTRALAKLPPSPVSKGRLVLSTVLVLVACTRQNKSQYHAQPCAVYTVAVGATVL
jgi:hypothetical protein